MGMTIAKPIQTLESLRDSGAFPFSTVDEVLYTAESIDVAIDTMRKYQRIAQIVEGWRADPEMDSADSMADIEGVINRNGD